MTDAFFQKNILTQSSNQIQEIEEALTFHRIRKGAENYSYRWFQFTQNTISQVYKTHAFRYATCVIGWECMRKVVYPFLSLIGRQDSIDSLERIPFWLMGKKAQKSTGSEWCSSLLKE